MPRGGWTMESGSVVEWLKHPGDLVREGELLLVIQTDKSTLEVESPGTGILRLAPDSPAVGVEVPIGTLLAYLDPASSELLAATPAGTAAPAAAARPSAPAPTAATPAPRVRASAPAASSATLDKTALLALYRQMLEIRRAEETLARLHASGLVHGACHTYVGEEAIATGVCAHLRPDDNVFSTHRGHGHALAKGVPPRELMAELLGRETGCSHGRGGSMHLFSPEVGLLGTSGIVGPSILLATGAAYSARLLKTDRVAVAFFGDGASNNGAFHEGLNLATIWDLPVIFVCENNLYATEVPFQTVSRQPDISARAIGYGLPSATVDGNDVLAVYDAAAEAVRRARAGEGPTLLECKTYRTRAHSEGMREAGYRTVDEIATWRARDPIPALRRQLLSAAVATEEELSAIDAAVEARMAEAADFARNSPWPDPATVAVNVYGE